MDCPLAGRGAVGSTELASQILPLPWRWHALAKRRALPNTQSSPVLVCFCISCKGLVLLFHVFTVPLMYRALHSGRSPCTKELTIWDSTKGTNWQREQGGVGARAVEEEDVTKTVWNHSRVQSRAESFIINGWLTKNYFKISQLML